MPVGKGFLSWGSLKKEVTYGTDPGGTRDGWFRIVPPETLTVDQSFYQSPGSGTRIVRGMHAGVFVCGGDISPETNFEGGWLHFVRGAMGSYTFSGSTPVAGTQTHTFSTADDLTYSYSMEVSKGDIPTGKVFVYKGVMVDQIEFGIEQDSLLSCTASVIAKTETTNVTAVASPTYPSELPIKNVYYNPSYTPGTATVVGSTVATLQSANIRVNNRLERRPNLGQYTAQPIPTEQREVLVSLTADFEDLTHYDKFIAETEGAFILNLTGPIITGATRYAVNFLGTTSKLISGTPTISDLGLIRATMEARLIKASPEFTIQVVNNQLTL